MSDTTVAPVKAAPIATTEVKPAETTGSTANSNPANGVNQVNSTNPANSINQVGPINPTDPIANPINQPVANPTESGGSIASGTPTPEQGKKLDIVA